MSSPCWSQISLGATRRPSDPVAATAPFETRLLRSSTPATQLFPSVAALRWSQFQSKVCPFQDVEVVAMKDIVECHARHSGQCRGDDRGSIGQQVATFSRWIWD